MGTNYYLQRAPNPCPTCGHDPTADRLHIGKSSAGRCFSLHVIPEEGIRDLADWETRWSKPGVRIVDEYGRDVTPTEMRKTITERAWGRTAIIGFNHEANNSQPGPSGLVRHRLGEYCVGHGAGTWDLVPGDFS